VAFLTASRAIAVVNDQNAHLDRDYIAAIETWRAIADGTRPNSLAARARRRRFAFFLSLISRLPRPLTILDVGGTPSYWRDMGFDDPDVAVTVLNLEREAGDWDLRQVDGDARAMTQFSDGEFDVVYSNSAIEHVGACEDQSAMATEVRRVGKRYFVQTPNLWFPLEPHFVFPGFQFMPVAWRVQLVQRFKLGHIDRHPDRGDAEQVVRSIRLLAARDLRSLFPGATLHRERVLGLTKSLMAVGGW
jgi:Methyltransferase domain